MPRLPPVSMCGGWPRTAAAGASGDRADEPGVDHEDRHHAGRAGCLVLSYTWQTTFASNGRLQAGRADGALYIKAVVIRSSPARACRRSLSRRCVRGASARFAATWSSTASRSPKFRMTLPPSMACRCGHTTSAPDALLFNFKSVGFRFHRCPDGTVRVITDGVAAGRLSIVNTLRTTSGACPLDGDRVRCRRLMIVAARSPPPFLAVYATAAASATGT